jgi:hypothetical protein
MDDRSGARKSALSSRLGAAVSSHATSAASKAVCSATKASPAQQGNLTAAVSRS